MQVKLKCPAGGEPQPSIQWLKDGLPIENVQRPQHLKPYTERQGILIDFKFLWNIWYKGKFTPNKPGPALKMGTTCIFRTTILRPAIVWIYILWLIHDPQLMHRVIHIPGPMHSQPMHRYILWFQIWNDISAGAWWVLCISTWGRCYCIGLWINLMACNGCRKERGLPCGRKGLILHQWDQFSKVWKGFWWSKHQDKRIFYW